MVCILLTKKSLDFTGNGERRLKISDRFIRIILFFVRFSTRSLRRLDTFLKKDFALLAATSHSGRPLQACTEPTQMYRPSVWRRAKSTKNHKVTLPTYTCSNYFAFQRRHLGTF